MANKTKEQKTTNFLCSQSRGAVPLNEKAPISPQMPEQPGRPEQAATDTRCGDGLVPQARPQLDAIFIFYVSIVL